MAVNYGTDNGLAPYGLHIGGFVYDPDWPHKPLSWRPFGHDQQSEGEHRKALSEAIQLAADRRRRFDDPWWAANMRALLTYIECLEQRLHELGERAP